jgi:hypothetical protein
MYFSFLSKIFFSFFLFIYVQVCTLFGSFLPPPPPCSPPHPLPSPHLTSRQNLFCPYLSFCCWAKILTRT